MKQKKIPIIKHGAFGDIVNSTGAFDIIRKNHPDDYLVLLTDPRFKNLSNSTGYFDEIMTDARSSNPIDILKLQHALKSMNFEKVYDLQNSARTFLYFWMLGFMRKTFWSGSVRGCSHRQYRKDREQLPASIRFADQLAVAGLNLFNRTELLPRIERLKADIRHLSPDNKNYMLLVPGSSQKGVLKRWPSEKYAGLARWLLQKGILPVLIGGPEDIEICQKICEGSPPILNLCNRTSFAEIASLGRKATGVVGNDTGPLHLIAAAGCPTFVLWSSFSDPYVYAPRGRHVKVLYEDDLVHLKVERVRKILEDSLQEKLVKAASVTL